MKSRALRSHKLKVIGSVTRARKRLVAALEHFLTIRDGARWSDALRSALLGRSEAALRAAYKEFKKTKPQRRYRSLARAAMKRAVRTIGKSHEV